MTRVAVVGAGLAGAAAAWRLAASGDEVTILESVVPAHSGGSSHGSARIFRHAYPDSFYVDLTVRARDEWDELEDAAGVELVRATGGLDFGRHRDRDAIAASLSAAGLPFERLSIAEAHERWPHLIVDTDVVYQPDAGVLDADQAVQSMVALAQQAGADLHTHTPVSGLRRDGQGWVVEAGELSVAADAVVLAPGAWLAEFDGMTGVPPLPPLTVSQQNAFFFARPAELADWPVFVHKGPMSVYSLPAGRDNGGAFKIAEHDGGSRTTARNRDGLVDPSARDRIVGYLRTYLPSVEPEPLDEQTCLYTMTPSEDFVIDGSDGLVIASVCSGHGAKFAPLTGSLIAEVVHGASPLPRFRLGAH